MDSERVAANSTPARMLALSGQKREALDALLRRRAAGRYAVIQRRGQTENVPLSFGQQRLWFLDQWTPGNPAYNLPAIFPLGHPVNVEAVRRTFGEILRRHTALRTRFRMGSGEPVQDVLPDISAEFQVAAPAAGSAREQRAEVARLVKEEIRRPFDLARGPLVRAALFPVGGSECILVFTMHHIAADGWSVGLLSQEFNAIYGAYSRGLPSPLEELPIQYTDFAIWQRECLGGGSLETQLAYWRRHLEGAPVLELPSCHPRPPAPTYRGAVEAFLIPADLRDKLQALARGESATMYMVLLAAFLLLLDRYSGQDDIVVGAPVAGRSRPETERLIGFFVNTLAIRVDAGDHLTFRECLGRVRKVVVEAIANQDVPFERLVQELQPGRDLSRHPLFQVTFQLFTGPQAGSRPELPVPGPIEIDKGTSIFDLAFNLWESSRGVEGRIEYSTDLFDAGYAARMGAHFVTLLQGIAADPDRRTAAFPLLTEGEREEILIRWNGTAAPVEDERCVHELVEDQAERTPNECAVAAGDVSLTYGELNRRANGYAHQLRELGVGLETPVAVCLDRSPDLIAVLLGVLKAGGAYVPIDPAYPAERVRAMIRDVGASVLVTRESLAPGVPAADARVLCVERMAAARDDNPEPAARPETLAYIIYTSGSTGAPKGVEVEHRALRNLLDWHRRAYAVTPQDRATQVASPSFDAAVWEIWPYLAAGACVCIADDETRADPGRLLEWLARHQIKICFLPTPLAEAVLRNPLPSDLALRALLTGGDRLRYLPQRDLPFRFTNHYGPTENTVVATFGPVTADESNPPIGRPIGNNQVYILDPNMQPAPVWVPGEIYIGGASLARGYRNRPDLTAERFVPNPFDARGATRLYRTGDLARYRPDGNVEFLGRTDRQVKIRGFRIEPGEVEAVLHGCPGIGQAVVTAREDSPGETRLAAYYVRCAGGALPDVRRYLKERLPDYMVPSAFVELESIPVTANGKIDERALPEPGRGTGVADRAEPRNAVEEVLAGIWAEVVNVDAIGVLDDFFRDYGGHSLLAVSLASRIGDALQTDLPVRAIFEAPTVRGLADRLLANPFEARRIEAVAELFLRVIEMPDEEAEGLLTGKEDAGQ